MGAWGSSIFESDAAMDFVGDIADQLGDDADAALKAMIESVDALAEDPEEDSWPETEALVAAEVFAALSGAASAEFIAKAKAPDEDDSLSTLAVWAVGNAGKIKEVDAKLLKRTAKVVRWISKKGELAELWNDADEEASEAWKAHIADLLQRLERGAKA